MKTPENLKSVKIDEIAATWDRAKVSSGAGLRFNSLTNRGPRNPWKSVKSHEIIRKHMKSMKINEIAAS